LMVLAVFGLVSSLLLLVLLCGVDVVVGVAVCGVGGGGVIGAACARGCVRGSWLVLLVLLMWVGCWWLVRLLLCVMSSSMVLVLRVVGGDVGRGAGAIADAGGVGVVGVVGIADAASAAAVVVGGAVVGGVGDGAAGMVRVWCCRCCCRC